MKTAQRTAIVSKAQGAAAIAETWADFSNFLFNPVDGLLTKAFQTKREREAFRKSVEYKVIRRLLNEAMSGGKLVDGATPRKSGKFVVRLPRTLHEILEREAVEEGTSLNQLVVFKLSAQLKATAIKKEVSVATTSR